MLTILKTPLIALIVWPLTLPAALLIYLALPWVLSGIATLTADGFADDYAVSGVSRDAMVSVGIASATVLLTVVVALYVFIAMRVASRVLLPGKTPGMTFFRDFWRWLGVALTGVGGHAGTGVVIGVLISFVVLAAGGLDLDTAIPITRLLPGPEGAPTTLPDALSSSLLFAVAATGGLIAHVGGRLSMAATGIWGKTPLSLMQAIYGQITTLLVVIALVRTKAWLLGNPDAVAAALAPLPGLNAGHVWLAAVSLALCLVSAQGALRMRDSLISLFMGHLQQKGVSMPIEMQREILIGLVKSMREGEGGAHETQPASAGSAAARPTAAGAR
ncbi:MAG: hypothetical protein AAFT19_09460 [Pseudomonadota bacterium]